jgi:hypothetical protein
LENVRKQTACLKTNNRGWELQIEKCNGKKQTGEGGFISQEAKFNMNFGKCPETDGLSENKQQGSGVEIGKCKLKG